MKVRSVYSNPEENFLLNTCVLLRRESIVATADPLLSLAVDVLPPIAYHRGTVAVSFGFRRMLNSMVNARDSRFILVQALDRRSSNDPTSSRCLPFALD